MATSVLTPPRVSVPAPRRARVGLATVAAMIVAALLLTPVIMLGGAAVFVSSRAAVHDATGSDAIVVLGAAQFDGRPSPILKSRLAHALELWREGVAPAIVTVGGSQPGDRYTEGGVGRDWLLARGVPTDAVVAVRTGTDTVTSLAAVAESARARNWQSITIVSDPAHMARSEAIAERLGFDPRLNPTVEGDGTEVTSAYLARETGGYLAFVLFEQWGMPRPVTDGA